MSSIALSSSKTHEPEGRSVDVDWKRFALVGLGTIGAALVANLTVYAVGGAVVGYDPRFLPLATAGGTVVFTLVPAVIAVLLYALLLRFARSPERVFTIVAVVVFVVTLIPDFTVIPTVPGVSAGQTAVLLVMHLVAAVVIVRMLTGLSRPGSR
jgi:hypothetical protein